MMTHKTKSSRRKLAYDAEYFKGRYADLSSTGILDELLLRMVSVRPADRVLDLGCGVGHLLAKLTVRANKALGVELSDFAASLAHEHGQVLLGDAERSLPFKDQVFDVVFAKDVIEHVSDLQAVLRELKRITRPGGRIVVVTPNFIAIKNLVLLMFGYKSPSYFDPTHVWFFNYLDTDLLTSGFQVLMKTTNWIISPKTLSWFRRLHLLAPLGDSLLLVLGRTNDLAKTQGA